MTLFNLINYTNEIASFSFTGIIWKSNESKNTDKTSIIIEFEDRLNINNFELKNISDLPIEDVPEFEKNLIKTLISFEANNIALKDNFIRIDTNYIFSTIQEFEDVTDLISRLKSYKQ